MASEEGMEGFKVRTEILNINSDDDLTFANKQIRNIISRQEKNGSWNDSLIETDGNVNLLLEYRCPHNLPEIDKAKMWMLSCQNTDHPFYQGLFLETKDTNQLQEKYVLYESLLTPSDSFCCDPNMTIATSCVLQVFFRTGEDISSNDRLGLAVDKIIALGNMVHGICTGNFEARIKNIQNL